MPKQTKVIVATGDVSGKRVHPSEPSPKAEWLDDLEEATPTYDAASQVVEPNNRRVGDKYVYGYTVRSLTAQELADLETQKWAVIRDQRDGLLASSDFTQLGDSPEDKLTWKTYRQELRDIPNQTDPDNITWPTKPG